MCTSPISIVNPSKYISLDHRQPFLLDVACGRCVECQNKKRNEWYFRTWYEVEDIINKGGYVLFDCLTYAVKNRPKISERLGIPLDNDFDCFNYEQFRLFMVDLRQRLNRCGYPSANNLRYFVTSEYGTRRGCDHAPHYHLLLFANNIPWNVLSMKVAESWRYGRTDGIPYKPAAYVKNNVFNSFAVSSIRAAKYVAKYVGKSCGFQNEIDRRIKVVYDNICSKHPYEWQKSREALNIKLRLYRLCNQFHKQSQYFGASYLKKANIDDILKTGLIEMPNSSIKPVYRIPIPLYYKRKLFFNLENIDGKNIWSINELGVKFRDIQNENIVRRLANKFAYHVPDHVDTLELSNYVVNFKGRIIADQSDNVLLSEKLNGDVRFNYSTRNDYDFFGDRFVSDTFLGNTLGYFPKKGNNISLNKFKEEFVINDKLLEKWSGFDQIVSFYYSYLKKFGQSKYEVESHKERLINTYKRIGLVGR